MCRFTAPVIYFTWSSFSIFNYCVLVTHAGFAAQMIPVWKDKTWYLWTFASSQGADPLSEGSDAVEEESGMVLMCSLINLFLVTTFLLWNPEVDGCSHFFAMSTYGCYIRTWMFNVYAVSVSALPPFVIYIFLVFHFP